MTAATGVIYDEAAEQATLGGCMLSTPIAQQVIEVVRPRDFYVPRHAVVFESIMRLVGAGLPTDTIAVTDDLLREGMLDKAGNAEFVHSLTSAITVAVQAPYYADIVADRAVRRRMQDAGGSIFQSAGQSDLPSLIDAAHRRIDEAAGIQQQPLTYVGDLIDQIVADAEKPRVVFPGPWEGLNDILGGGFRPGALYVLAARPGIGKTAIALQIAAELAQLGPVGFSSLEMPREELVRRIIAQGAQMPHHALEQGKPLMDLWKRKIEAWKDIAPHAIALDDRSTVTMPDVRAFARNVKRPGGKIAGVVFDYLQLMGGPAGMPRHEIVSENARNFKLLARELECPVILLSQLNRDSEKRMDRRPQLSDLRESGAIEQDADVVMMLYRDPDFEQAPVSDVPLPVPLELGVVKNRHGPTLTHTLYWEGTQMRAYESRGGY